MRIARTPYLIEAAIMTESTFAAPRSLMLAGRILVLTGILHCLGWLVSGWSFDTARLIPFGVVYAVLGCLLMLGHLRARYVALAVTLIGATAASITMNTAAVALWFTGVLIAIDVVVLALLVVGVRQLATAKRASLS
jgi:hypothetical protein